MAALGFAAVIDIVFDNKTPIINVELIQSDREVI
jgi:hypothetical protein